MFKRRDSWEKIDCKYSKCVSMSPHMYAHMILFDCLLFRPIKQHLCQKVRAHWYKRVLIYTKVNKSPQHWALLTVVVDGKSRSDRPGAAAATAAGRAPVSPHCLASRLSPDVSTSLSLWLTTSCLGTQMKNSVEVPWTRNDNHMRAITAEQKKLQPSLKKDFLDQ